VGAAHGRDLIEFVSQSPKLCQAHNRAAWVGLFGSDGQVNDPVGSRPHDGREAIERFYDTFIAPNHLSFAVQNDIVCGMTVMRDLDINTVMSTGAKLSVPMHLRYELVEEDGALRIRRIYAHWELPGMMWQMTKLGLKGLWTSIMLTPRLLRYQGIGGLIGFMRGLFGSGRAGKRTAEAFFAAAKRGGAAAAGALLGEGCVLEVPPGTRVTLSELLPGLRELKWRKVIGAGNFASATVQIGPRRGVALLRFDEGPARISGLQIYV
jgi:hypothetical protein